MQPFIDRLTTFRWLKCSERGWRQSWRRAETLFKKCVKIRQWKFNSSIDDVEELFDQMRQVINHFYWN